MKISRIGLVAAAAASTLLVATGCGAAAAKPGGGAPTDAEKVYQEFGKLKGEERRAKLIEAAEKEGTLHIYTSMTDTVATAVEAEFEKDFDIDVQTYRAGSSTVLTKLGQEFKARTTGADIVETNSLEMFALNELGALAPYESEGREKVAPNGQYENWTATRYNVFSPSWNTDLVSPDEAPTSWEDLADPKWDGRLALELEDYDWYMALYQYWESEGKSAEEIDRLFKDIADGAEVQKGHTTMADLHQSGKFDLAASNYTYIVEQKKREGAPLEYRPLTSPVFARSNGFGMISNAGNPAAAMLFADWFLEEGQRLMFDKGLTVAVVPEGEEDPMKDVEIVFVNDDELINNNAKWDDAYQELLRNTGSN